MKRLLSAINAAFSYFSILPVAGRAAASPPSSGSLLALPLVGVAIGGLAGLGAQLVARVLSAPLSSATAFGLSIALSGAIHVDGFLDCSDAVFAEVAPARRLEILKDPHHGSFAIATMAAISAVWIASLQTCQLQRLPALLAYSAALVRYAAVVNAAIFPAASGPRSTEALRIKLRLDALLAEAALFVMVARTLGPRVWVTVPLSLIGSIVLARPVVSRLGGGLTGDAYGFLIVALEPAIIAVTAALTKDEAA
jgi:adenosylcobinamide-GDP ribazoletransferase